MKKVLALILALCMVFALAACGGNSGGAKEEASGGKTKLNLWATGSDNVRQIFETLVADFNSKNDKYEVELQFMASGTGAQSLVDLVTAAVQAGQTNTDYDIVDFSGDDWSKITNLIGADKFVKLDVAKMPNAAGVAAKSSVEPDYCQPYRGTTVILAYDSVAVPTPPATFDELVQWIKDHPGRFDYNAVGTGGAGNNFAYSCVYNLLPEEAFTSSDEKWVAEWDKGFDLLKELHPYMLKSGGSIVYLNKNQGTLDALNNGEIDMCPNWADMVLSQRAKGEIKDTIKITQITPGLPGSLQSLAIPTIGSHEDGAYAFIDYMLSPAAQEIMVKQMAAIPLIDVSTMDMTGYEDLNDLDVSNFRICSIGGLSTIFNERWDNEIAPLG